MPNLKIEYDGEREKERNRGGGGRALHDRVRMGREEVFAGIAY